MKTLLVTGSSGLIGSEVVRYFDRLGWKIIGVDNDMRADFFGEKGTTRWVQQQLIDNCNNFQHVELDIRNREGVYELMKRVKPDYICHTAAQPSHDLAASRPFDDFDVNAVGTLNLLEAARQHCIGSPFVHMSTNKVYGDAPNLLNLVEQETRYDFCDQKYYNGIKESFTIDQSKHS
ncbi:MAG: NAD-dependent epimerase/dehydratase family protein, partial [Flavobacteriales bacterium]|nr:NAD-dependent epimerase/dehydratase family protein [Flavobacteriales bacterium]